ncbi:MAG: Holliday junction branch migration protein RuvA [Armatimonadetes bacterium]|nr:Holliday junction branch migration protein RuvA [Armatimonadota bacterium]
MISRLRGTLLDIENGAAVVDVQGVGYLVNLPEAVLLTLPEPGAELSLYIRQIVREDDLLLYGFATAFQRRFFDLLTTVNGCGPKVALAVIGVVGEEPAASAIIRQDAKFLTKAPGVGAKLAERIVVDLKDKMGQETFAAKLESLSIPTQRTSSAPADELVDALMNLGYRRPEAEQAAITARESSSEISEQLRLALRSLTK